MRRAGYLLAVAAVASAATPAFAQRREGSAETSTAPVALPTSSTGAVQLSEMGSTAPPGGEPTTELGLVEQALPRLEAAVIAQCADRAHKSKWETDNAKFEKCVCPQVAKWRLPKVSHELRVQRALSKGKNGYSFTSDSAGRPHDCRVWSGVSAPNDDSVAWRTVPAQKPERKRQ